MSNASVSHLQDASEKLGTARDHIIVGVADAVNSGVDAAREATARAGEGLDSLIEQGTEVIRSRPWATVGVALATGYLLAKFRGRN